MADYKTINQANTFSQEKLQQIRAMLALKLKDSYYKEKITVITTGSYGRAEASGESDLDLFILFDSDLPAEDTIQDIIRYYRTMATDFEFKVSEQKKEWGLRNIKLRFSRKLIYFGGLIVSAELVGLSRDERIKKAVGLFSKPVLVRLRELDSPLGQAQDIFSHYEAFLEKISDHDLREELVQLEKADSDSSDAFKALRDQGVVFSKALDSWLKAKYLPEHSIHHSLIF